MLVAPVHQVGVRHCFAFRTEFRGRNPYHPAFCQIALHQPERQVSPADSGEDERMLGHVVTYPPCSRRQNVEITTLRKRRWILRNDLHMIRQIRRCDRTSRCGKDTEGVTGGDDCGALNKGERPPLYMRIGKIDSTDGQCAATLP